MHTDILHTYLLSFGRDLPRTTDGSLIEESFCRDSIYKVCFEFHSVRRDYLCDRDDDEPLFDYNSLTIWVKRQQIPLTRLAIHSILGDLRKLAEQNGDTILWEQSNQ